MRKTRATRNAAPVPESPARTSETLRAQSDGRIAEPAPGRNDENKPEPKAKAPRERPARLRDLLHTIRSWGGIDPLYHGDVTGESKGFGTVFRKGGLDMGEIATRMEEEGFLTRDQIEDDTDNMGIAHATDLIRRALDGEVIYNANDMIEVAPGNARRNTSKAW